MQKINFIVFYSCRMRIFEIYDFMSYTEKKYQFKWSNVSVTKPLGINFKVSRTFKKLRKTSMSLIL